MTVSHVARSPCPVLNALANHNYLPRNGKDLDYAMINNATQEAYNFASGVPLGLVNEVFQFYISTTNKPNETFNLVDLARHDTIEVDGSLTRNNIWFGDDWHFDATVFAPVTKDLGLSEYHHADNAGGFVTVETAAKATKNRYELAKRVNPVFNASAAQHALEYATTALYLLTLWDEEKQAAPKAWVKALLGELSCNVRSRASELFTDSLAAEDRIAYREGYSKGSSVKTAEDIGNMTVAVRAVAGWKA
jgi:hypothetical protein